MTNTTTESKYILPLNQNMTIIRQQQYTFGLFFKHKRLFLYLETQFISMGSIRFFLKNPLHLWSCLGFFSWLFFDRFKVFWGLLIFWHQDYPGILGFEMTINFDMSHLSTLATCKHGATPSLMVDYQANITMFQLFGHPCLFFSKWFQTFISNFTVYVYAMSLKSQKNYHHKND